jgi:Sec-independent protein translocase protein TatA
MSGTQYNVAQTAGAILKKARKELADARSATYEGSKSDDRIKAAEKAVDSATNDFHKKYAAYTASMGDQPKKEMSYFTN